MGGQDGPANVSATAERSVLHFSIAHMDQSIDPREDFYGYATGSWRRNNPVPDDKSIWGAFSELIERNALLLREILESAAADGTSPEGSPRRQVGDFYASALDQARRDALGLTPIEPLLSRIGAARTSADLAVIFARLHEAGISAPFRTGVFPDRNHSSIYAFYLQQGGLGLPDREYYLTDSFAGQREGYRAHLQRMFRLLGDGESEAAGEASTVLSLETELARGSRSATDLRDQAKNHNPRKVEELVGGFPGLPWAKYLAERNAGSTGYVVVGQPEFFAGVEALLASRPLSDWTTYLRWHVLHRSAPFLSAALENEDFDFFRRTLLGQKAPEPAWKRAGNAVSELLGEALGQLYVERHFPPVARDRMVGLVADLRAVFRDRLQTLDWMTEPTRVKALAKFDRFTSKIGHPERFRDYSSILVRRDEYAANVQRAAAFEVRRQMNRIGGPVDRSEWGMPPQMVNAYFNATQNEIVFPAGILQPPFFDAAMDDAVNFGGIGAVIGHEITHGYDDQGRRFDADGNLGDWWSEADAREFDARAKLLVGRYSRLEGLPGVHVNGELTLGENIADFGGVSLAYEALQRRLAASPAARTPIDGLTPEQRFFVSWAQVWRQNCREPERRRRLTIDPHAPEQFRAVTPLENFPGFAEAFPVGRETGRAALDEPRARIW